MFARSLTLAALLLAAPALPTDTAYASDASLAVEQGTVCTGTLNAPIADVQAIIDDMCYNVTGGVHQPVRKTLPDLNAWFHVGRAGEKAATVVAIDGDARWESCSDSFQAILEKCAKDGQAPTGMMRVGRQLYVISEKITDVPALKTH